MFSCTKWNNGFYFPPNKKAQTDTKLCLIVLTAFKQPLLSWIYEVNGLSCLGLCVKQMKAQHPRAEKPLTLQYSWMIHLYFGLYYIQNLININYFHFELINFISILVVLLEKRLLDGLTWLKDTTFQTYFILNDTKGCCMCKISLFTS